MTEEKPALGKRFADEPAKSGLWYAEEEGMGGIIRTDGGWRNKEGLLCRVTTVALLQVPV